MRENQLSARKTTPTRLIFGIQWTKKSFVSRAERILTRERVATCIETTRGTLALVGTRYCVKICLSALDTKYTILSAVHRKLVESVSLLRAKSWFFSTSAGKSTFSTQNDADSANFRYTADKRNRSYHVRRYEESRPLSRLALALKYALPHLIRNILFSQPV